jgi:hypothetical protein
MALGLKGRIMLETSCRRGLIAAGLIGLVALVAGCGRESAPPQASKKAAKKSAPKKQDQPTRPAEETSRAKERSQSERPPERTLVDLVAQGEAEKERPIDPLRYALPEVDEAKCATRGIRKLQGEHLTLYTDVASSPAVDELPRVFDLALPQWLAYFEIEPKRGEKWRMVGVLADKKERFAETGLWPEDLPQFLHGYMRDRQFWLYEQPSDFYRRHLLLHEGTHGFMWNFLNGLGPPWYAEGMAELLGTHEWNEGKLKLGMVPPSKEASPLWGRVKIIKDGYAAKRALQLREVMQYASGAHLKTEPYGWCWAAAVFLDHDPKYQKIFREAPQTVADVSQQFSERLLNRLPEPRAQVFEQWQCFVANIEYGYDVARESIVRQEMVSELPAKGANVEVATDRGWQSTGYTLQAGKTYQLTGTGQFQIGKSTKPWMSEANGITLKYYKGRPIGQLLAAVTDEGKSGGLSPLVRPVAVGQNGQLKCENEGVLYLRVNDSPAELADNAGKLNVSIRGN